jgi:hypothetical protein
MANSSHVITSRAPMKNPEGKVYGERIVTDWTADDSNGSVPNLVIPGMTGIISSVITNPGATAPTDNYDIYLYHPSDSSLDVLGDALANRDTATSEVKGPSYSGSNFNVAVSGNYTLAVSNNSVNSATGQIVIECLFL